MYKKFSCWIVFHLGLKHMQVGFRCIPLSNTRFLSVGYWNATTSKLLEPENYPLSFIKHYFVVCFECFMELSSLHEGLMEYNQLS